MLTDYFSEVNDHGTVFPVKDVNAVDWSSYAKTGAHNIIIRGENSLTRKDVAYTVNANETVTANGTADGESRFHYGYVIYNEGDELEISGVSGGSYQTYYIGYTFKNADNTYLSEESLYNGKKTIVVPANTKFIEITCVIQNGYTADNIPFSPMVKYASDPIETFTRPAPSNYELQASHIFKKTVTATTSANGNVNLVLDPTVFAVLSAFCTTADYSVIPNRWNASSWGVQVRDVYAAMNAVINTEVTIDIYYIRLN